MINFLIVITVGIVWLATLGMVMGLMKVLLPQHVQRKIENFHEED